jgi:hypothetical protein
LNQCCIGGQARQHFAGLRDFEKRGIHRQDFAIHGIPEVGDHTFAKPGHQIEPQRGKHPEQQRDSEQRDEITVYGSRIVRGQPFVDQKADRNGQG